MIENKTIDDKRLVKITDVIQTNPDIMLENSCYGEAIRLRAELLPKPERQIININREIVTLPAEPGIDVLTAPLSDLKTVLANSFTPNNGKRYDFDTRIKFILKIITIRFPSFNILSINLPEKLVEYYNKMKRVSSDDVNFLGNI